MARSPSETGVGTPDCFSLNFTHTVFAMSSEKVTCESSLADFRRVRQHINSRRRSTLHRAPRAMCSFSDGTRLRQCEDTHHCRLGMVIPNPHGSLNTKGVCTLRSLKCGLPFGGSNVHAVLNRDGGSTRPEPSVVNRFQEDTPGPKQSPDLRHDACELRPLGVGVGLDSSC